MHDIELNALKRGASSLGYVVAAIGLSACAIDIDLQPSAAWATGGAEWRASSVKSADGATIAYYVSGSGDDASPPLIVVSGGPGSDHRYMRIGGAFAEIAKTRRVVMFDQRGTGASSDAGEGARFENWAADVEAIRTALGVVEIDLMGHSFGGLVSMAYAELNGDHIRRLILVDSTAPKLSENRQLLADIYPDRIEEWRETRAGLSPRFSAPEISVFFSMEFVDPALSPRYEETVADFMYNINVNNTLRAELGDVDYTKTMRGFDRPTLVLHGRQDAVLAPAVAWALGDVIPNASVVFIDQSGHLPFVEQPDAFAEAVERFLSKPDAPAR